jgi:pimeloyl-ACP methyl ester carboxylesterase
MSRVPNIVLVHGAWADGSSWRGVVQPLQHDGYPVAAAQLLSTSLEADVALVRQLVAGQTGPTLLVGHSFGGAIITQLGANAPNVLASGLRVRIRSGPRRNHEGLDHRGSSAAGHRGSPAGREWITLA